MDNFSNLVFGLDRCPSTISVKTNTRKENAIKFDSMQCLATLLYPICHYIMHKARHCIYTYTLVDGFENCVAGAKDAVFEENCANGHSCNECRRTTSQSPGNFLKSHFFFAATFSSATRYIYILNLYGDSLVRFTTNDSAIEKIFFLLLFHEWSWQRCCRWQLTAFARQSGYHRYRMCMLV